MTIVKPTSLAVALSMICTMPVMASSLVDFDGLQSDYVGTTAKQLTVTAAESSHTLMFNNEPSVAIVNDTAKAANTAVTTNMATIKVGEPFLCLTSTPDSANDSVVNATVTTQNGATYNLQKLNDGNGQAIVYDPFAKSIQLFSDISNKCASFSAENKAGVYGDGKMFFHGFEGGGGAGLAMDSLALTINPESRDSDAYQGLPFGYKRVVLNTDTGTNSGSTDVGYMIEVKNRGAAARTFTLMEYLPSENNIGYSYANLLDSSKKWVGLEPKTVGGAASIICTPPAGGSCGDAATPTIEGGVVKVSGISLPAGETVQFNMQRQTKVTPGAVSQQLIAKGDQALVAVAVFADDDSCNGHPDCRAIYSFIAS